MVSVWDYDEALARGRETSAGYGTTLWGILSRYDAERVAAMDAQGHKTFGDLIHEAEECAALWFKQGVGPRDAVGVQIPNRWDFLVSHVALALLGAVTTSIHVPYSPVERRALLEFIGARGWVDDADQAVIHVIAGPDDKKHESSESMPDPTHMRGSDPFTLFFTSGTHSVKPKPCLHSHAGLLDNARTVAEEVETA